MAGCGDVIWSVQIVTDEETSKEPVAFVASLLAMQTKFDTLLREAFFRDAALREVMRKCLADGLNLQDSIAKLLGASAIFLSRSLRTLYGLVVL